MKNPEELQQAVVLAKTYLADNLNEGLALESSPLKLSRDGIIDLYLESLKEIMTEYQGFEDGFPEIPHVFDSPSFRILLSRTCEYFEKVLDKTQIKDPGGYYRQLKNYICINFEYALADRKSFEELKNWLKEVLRHEFHHASETILHASFLKQPEVPVPCKYHTDFEHDNDFFSGRKNTRKKFYRSFDDIVSTLEFSEPAYPFDYDSAERHTFLELYSDDLQDLHQTVNSDPEVRALIQSHYRPARWEEHLNLERDYDKETAEALQKALLQSKSYCIQVTFHDFNGRKLQVPLCVTEMKPGDNGVTRVFGYTAEDPLGEGIFQAFLNDIEWRLNIVKFRYSCMGCNILEQDAFLFGSIPYPIYRRLFKGLESVRIQEYLRFQVKADYLAACELPPSELEDIDPKKMEECLEKICKGNFIFQRSLKELH